MGQPILTISILISNNYDNVKRCLDSIQDLLKALPSELILTDTGCGPEVREVIEKYTDHIIDFAWCKDFSAARNAGLKQAKGQWFMYLDDDEWFEDTRDIEQFFLSGEAEKYNVAYYTQRNYIHPYDDQYYKHKISEISYKDHYVDRVIRRVPGLHFEHRIHEAYTGIEIGRKKRLDVFVHHYGYAYKDAEENRKKRTRNRELLELEVRDYPDDMRMRYQLTTVCYAFNDWDYALSAAREGIAMESQSAYWDELHNCILYCLQRQGKWQESIDTANDFLQGEFYPYTYMGMYQYLLMAYWKLEKYGDVLRTGKRILDIYADYKLNQKEYDKNQIFLDQYQQEDQIVSVLLMIIEAMLADQAEESLSLLNPARLQEEISALTDKPAYCYGLRNIIKKTCTSGKAQEFLKKLPFPEDFIDEQLEAIRHPQEVFVRPRVPMDGGMAEAIELKEVSLPADFFRGETRNGFYIEPLMKHAWAASLNILYKVGQICKANGLPYYVDWGTLLGTVRHHGFIAWDDDIDVSMMRNDMLKLAQIIDEQYPELMFIDYYSSKAHGMQAFRVANTRKLLPDRKQLKDSCGFIFPAGIDIFPLDKLPDEAADRDEMESVLTWVSVANSIYEELRDKTLLDEDYFIKVRILETAVGEVEKICNVAFRDKIPERQELLILMDEVQGLYRDEGFSSITHLFAYGNKKFIVDKENYAEVIMMPFETIMVPVPAGYDRILTGEYGSDYMTPKQVPSFHDYPFYKKHFKTLSDAMKAENQDEFRIRIERRSAGYYVKFLQATAEPVLEYAETEFESEDSETEELKRIRGAEAEVLEEINRICSKYKLKVYMINEEALEPGSDNVIGLGHELQLGMFRDQYKKFIDILPEELDVWFDYRDIYHGSSHAELRTYIISDAYKTKEEDYRKRFHGCPHIVGLTIVPIDGMSENQTRESLRKKAFDGLMRSSKTVAESGPYPEEALKLVEEWKTIVQVKYSDTCNLRQEFVRAADLLAASSSITDVENVTVFKDPDEGSMKLWSKADFDHCVRIAYGKSSVLLPVRA